MVFLTSHFTLLSAILSLVLTSVDAVVIPKSRPSAAVAGQLLKGRERVENPTILLPKGAKHNKSLRSEKEANRKMKQRQRRFYGDYTNPLNRIAGALIGGGDSYYDVHANPLVDVYVATRQQKPFQAPRRKRSDDGVSGTIDIMSKDGDTEKRVASLFLEIDNSTETPKYAFGASDTNSTQLLLVPDADSPEPSNAVVSLQIPMFDRQTASEVYYCITYDPNPPEPEPFGLAQCVNGTLPNSQSSQSFAYDGSTGNIQPMWLNQSTSSTDSASVSTRDNSDSQNMILKFQPLEPEAPVSAQSVEDAQSAEDDSGVVTETTTSTMTVTMTSSSSSASATGTTVTYSSAASSSLSPTMTASASTREGALAVEFVSSSSGMPKQTVSASSTAVSPTSTVDADAVAESIAATDTGSELTTDSVSSSSSTTATDSSTPASIASPTSTA